MLRQGVSVTDILYLTPEGAPHIFEPPEDAVTGKDILREKKAYHFDVVSPLILMEHATVEGGRISFENGSSYRVLVLPLIETMTPELATSIERLARKGATIIGVPPKKSPSFAGYPRCDKRVAEVSKQLWGTNAVPAESAERKYGKGLIVWGGATTKSASTDKLYPSYESTVAYLQKQGIRPAFHSTGNLRYICRQTKDRDIFFVGNRDAAAQGVTATFRTDGGVPEFWNPTDGSRRALTDFHVYDGIITMPITLAPYESGFVVFKRNDRDKNSKTINQPPATASNFPELKPVQELTGPWEVTFDAKWGGPKTPATFTTLSDWTTHADPAIKFYSGIATYKTTFNAPSQLVSRLYLSLGTLHKIARVNLNGKAVGIVWTPPYRLEVTDKLLPTGNVLEIEVANTWVNRLIGDQQPGDKGVRPLKWENGLLGGTSYQAGRYTFTTVNNYTPKSPLQESGMMGPVMIMVSE
jgi:hypothetical protein